jgi:hypothetical protein
MEFITYWSSLNQDEQLLWGGELLNEGMCSSNIDLIEAAHLLQLLGSKVAAEWGHEQLHYRSSWSSSSIEATGVKTSSCSNVSNS